MQKISNHAREKTNIGEYFFLINNAAYFFSVHLDYCLKPLGCM